MCGIFALLNNSSFIKPKNIYNAFNHGQGRGPEKSDLVYFNQSLTLGFHRLAINGLDEISGQPMTINNITLICNGEIYNYKELFTLLNVIPQTNSDCEIIIHLYIKYGIETTVSLLDGVFSFVLYDKQNKMLHVARDPFGVRPLYMLTVDKHPYDSDDKLMAFASDMKVLNETLNKYHYLGIKKKQEISSINQFSPGKVITFNYDKYWLIEKDVRYHTIKYSNNILKPYNYDDRINAYKNIYNDLNSAVRKRVIGTSDRPIACLLSGGLDSSLIAALVSKYYGGQLETYSIGMEGSVDLKYAREVAKYIKSKHHEITFKEDDFFNSIPEVIYNIESYDTTTVRASVGNYLIGKYISENSEAKVIFNGDGSDELTGGYIYFLAVDTDIEFDKECKRLLKNIYNFDVLRSDKCISSCGLEPRTPFLDKDFVNNYLQIPISVRNPKSIKSNRYVNYNKNDNPVEKLLLRESIAYMEPTLLPANILWRTKEAFSDGVSGDKGSWFDIIKDKVSKLDNIYEVENYNPLTNHNMPKTLEQKYYRKIFDEYFPYHDNVIPYFWMPKYVKTDDASARTITFYNDVQK